MEPAQDACRAFYRPRRPQETPLYRLLDRHFDEFKSTYEERFTRRYGPWRPLWDKVVPKYIDCGVYECGFARIRCPGCKKEFLLAFSCKTRLCPTCEQKRILLFAEKTTEEILLAVPHRFWTFSIPKALRGIMLRDRRLLKLIPRCAFDAVKQAMKEALPRGGAKDGAPGAILAIHTAGNLLQWNPHVHGIVTEGAGIGAAIFAYEPERSADAFARKKRQSWARLIEKIWEVSPLTCPRCGGEMRVVSVIMDTDVIDRILRQIEKKGRAPPEGEVAA